MNVYKILMQQNREVPKITENRVDWEFLSRGNDYFISLDDSNIFAIKYDVEQFVSDRERYKSVFERNFISQLILTNYKFVMLPLYSDELGIKIGDVQYYSLCSESLDVEILRSLKKIKKINEVEGLLDILDENKLIIKSMSFRCSTSRNQSIKINSNGTITSVKSNEDTANLVSKIIGFLFKGPSII